MKVRPSVKPMCEKCKVIKRKGKVMVFFHVLRSRSLHGIQGEDFLIFVPGIFHDGFRQPVVISLDGQHAGQLQLIYFVGEKGHGFKAGFTFRGTARKGRVIV